MIYKFCWTQTLRGETEVEANCGNEAERVFKEMTVEKKLEISRALEMDSQSLSIDFVDVDFIDNLSGDDWKKSWKNIV